MSSNTIEEIRIDPRIKRTRELLTRAFIEVISEKGFQAVSVHDITEKAGVNRTTFYLHFADKYALLDYSIQQLLHQEIEKRMDCADCLSMDNLRLLIITVCDFILRSNTGCATIDPQFESLVEMQVKKRVYEILLGWLNLEKGVRDANTAATAASWAIYGLALQWSHEKQRTAVEQFADRVLPLISTFLGMAQPA